jgi:Grx4 family monothiol glutaredoxin
LEAASQLADVQASAQQKNVLLFWASWHEPSKMGGPMHSVFAALAQKFPAIQFASVEAEGLTEVSERFEVSVVPTFICCVGNRVIEKVEGINPAEINSAVKRLASLDAEGLAGAASSSIGSSKDALTQRLQRLIGTAPVMLFMKGNPSQPRCGFSRKIVEILQTNAVPFASFDILTDEEVRAGLKEYSDWPTYPQLYVNGVLTGGLDILQEMAAAGNLKEQLGVQNLSLPPVPPTLQERLKQLVNQEQVMLFMKGKPEQPQCGFSRSIVQLLQQEEIKFGSFNILSDDEVRSGLKEFSDWPTYPQLYVNGSLVGGLDIVKEMAESGNLKAQLGLV